ncbi:hypothetical protein ADUPG1_008028, partial [Aduncisulcus paluster]
HKKNNLKMGNTFSSCSGKTKAIDAKPVDSKDDKKEVPTEKKVTKFFDMKSPIFWIIVSIILIALAVGVTLFVL